MNSAPDSPPNVRKSPLGLLILAWGVVGIPLGWGVTLTILNALPLFLKK